MVEIAPRAALAAPSHGWTARASWVALGVCIASASALRFYAIDHLPGINGDEPQYAVHAHSFFRGAPIASLRTGSDLPMNPVFFGTVLLLQGLLPATLLSLRLAAVVLSLATIYLSWALFRRRGRMFAASFACLVAVLPIHLGYARFAWDPSAIPTASVLALGAATRLRPAATALAFALCLWVHPTMVFLGPVLVAPFVTTRWARGSRALRHASPARRRGLGLALLLALFASGWLMWWLVQRGALPGAVMRALHGSLLTDAFERARHPAELGGFVRAFAELLSGPTIYRYIAGSLPDRAARMHLWASALVLAPLLALGSSAQITRRRRVDLAVTAGLAVSLLAEYLLAGPAALAPKTERYAVCLTAPACYVIAACVDALGSSPARRSALRAGSAALSVALLASFGRYYLAPLHRPDPQREDTFRTGPVEPKRLALEAVTRLRAPGREALIYVEDWWIYWTVRYLAPPETGTRVTIYKHAWDYRFPHDFEPPRYDPARMQLFGIAWAGHGLDTRFKHSAREQVEIFGYEPGPILRVYVLRELPRRRSSRRRRR